MVCGMYHACCVCPRAVLNIGNGTIRSVPVTLTHPHHGKECGTHNENHKPGHEYGHLFISVSLTHQGEGSNKIAEWFTFGILLLNLSYFWAHFYTYEQTFQPH